MSKLQAILTYQETDKKLYAMEREIASCEERKEYVRARKFMESAAERLDLLDSKAARIKGQALELENKYSESEKKLEDFSDLDELMKNGGDIAFYRKNALSIGDELKKMKSEISALNENIRSTSDEYQKLKKQVISMQKTFAEAKEKYVAVKDSKEQEMNEIKARLVVLAKDIPEEVMKKYEAKRKEKVFPVIGALNEKRCPFCSMEPPIAAINKLASGGTIECDNCHRILYKE